MTRDEREQELARARDEIAARLRGAGIATTNHDSSDDLVRLLDAVEAFERTVERHGGDLMVDEPVGRGRPLQPDDRSFVLPQRRDGEAVAGFIERINEQRDRAARRPNPSS